MFNPSIGYCNRLINLQNSLFKSSLHKNSNNFIWILYKTGVALV